jgi:4-deoxy-L-threo-5-hexosulose-uronate ketol-isomerase
LYSDLDEGIAVHLMGEPEQTRHLIVRDREAVLSPAWSLHSGAGTRPYSFIWGMAGENQSFTDMDAVKLNQLR